MCLHYDKLHQFWLKVLYLFGTKGLRVVIEMPGERDWPCEEEKSNLTMQSIFLARENEQLTRRIAELDELKELTYRLSPCPAQPPEHLLDFSQSQ